MVWQYSIACIAPVINGLTHDNPLERGLMITRWFTSSEMWPEVNMFQTRVGSFSCCFQITDSHIWLKIIISSYIISHYIISYYIILCYIISYYIILHYTILYYITVYHIISYYIILHHNITSYYIILYHIISYYIILYHKHLWIWESDNLP